MCWKQWCSGCRAAFVTTNFACGANDRCRGTIRLDLAATDFGFHRKPRHGLVQRGRLILTKQLRGFRARSSGRQPGGSALAIRPVWVTLGMRTPACLFQHRHRNTRCLYTLLHRHACPARQAPMRLLLENDPPSVAGGLFNLTRIRIAECPKHVCPRESNAGRDTTRPARPPHLVQLQFRRIRRHEVLGEARQDRG